MEITPNFRNETKNKNEKKNFFFRLINFALESFLYAKYSHTHMLFLLGSDYRINVLHPIFRIDKKSEQNLIWINVYEWELWDNAWEIFGMHDYLWIAYFPPEDPIPIFTYVHIELYGRYTDIDCCRYFIRWLRFNVVVVVAVANWRFSYLTNIQMNATRFVLFIRLVTPVLYSICAVQLTWDCVHTCKAVWKSVYKSQSLYKESFNFVNFSVHHQCD